MGQRGRPHPEAAQLCRALGSARPRSHLARVLRTGSLSAAVRLRPAPATTGAAWHRPSRVFACSDRSSLRMAPGPSARPFCLPHCPPLEGAQCHWSGQRHPAGTDGSHEGAGGFPRSTEHSAGQLQETAILCRHPNSGGFPLEGGLRPDRAPEVTCGQYR